MMNGSGIAEFRMSVGVADCHKMHTLLVRLVHRQDAFRRKSMDCRDHGCSHQCGKRIWLVIAPWILDFASHVDAMWTHVVLGLLVAAISAWALWDERQNPHAPA